MRATPGTAPNWPAGMAKPLTILSALACCLSVGCGDSGAADRYRVEGRVNIDSVPLEKGLIIFIPIAPTEGPKASGIVDQGEYAIEKGAGPYCGEFLVKIETVPRAIEAIAAGKAPAEEVRRRAKQRPVVAPEYNRMSRLQVVVRQHAENRFDFDVESVRGNQPRR